MIASRSACEKTKQPSLRPGRPAFFPFHDSGSMYLAA